MDHLLIHRCAIIRTVTDDDLADRDDWNNPTEATPAVFSEVDCLVQERAGREVPQASGDGTVISDAVIFVPIETDVVEGDMVHRLADVDLDVPRAYSILHRKDVAGQGHHYELDAQNIRTPDR